MTNREKFLIAIIIILGALAFYYAFKCSRKIEVHFSKPVNPVGNFLSPERPDIWQIK